MLTSKQICVITPTKGRHKLLATMLESLAGQTGKVGQVIIADGGRDAEHVVTSFQNKLPIQWLDCPVAGQIPQRNLALKQLNDDIKVVIYFDDDIIQEPDSMANLIKFWNEQEEEPAGISFNLFGLPKQKDSFIRKVFCMELKPAGRVLSSGYNTPITELEHDIRSEWLIGGATAWRRDILEDQTHAGIATSWAICEDLIFSYPVGKQQPLYVCAKARVRDGDTPRKFTFSEMRSKGRRAVLWRFFFVSQHKELSKPAFFWMMLGQTAPRLIIGVLGKFSQLGHGLGHLEAVFICLRSLIIRQDPKEILE